VPSPELRAPFSAVRWWDPWLDRVPFLRKRRAPSRQEVLGAIPVRNDRIEWELRADEGSDEDAAPVVVLQVPRRQDRLGRMMNRIFEAPSHRQVVLDELGTDVWQLCDGRNSIEALIRELARRHKLERREVEVSLTTYLRTLTQRGFIGLKSPETPGTE
jgi:hypothetical protein